MLSPSSEAISKLSLLDHYCRGDTLTPSNRFNAICVKSDLTNQYRNVRVLTNFWLSAISDLRSYLRAILVTPLWQRWYSYSELSLISYFMNLVSKLVQEKSLFDQFWLSAISELRSYFQAILVRSLLQRWYSNAEQSL